MFKYSSHQITRKGRLVRWGILGLSSAPIFGAYVYNQGHRIGFLKCPILHFTGIPCPSCGMTRAFMAIARWDLHKAIEYHLFSPIIFTGFVITIVHVSFELLVKRQVTTFYIKWCKIKKAKFFMLFLFLSYYLIRLYWWKQTGDILLRV
jgi:hypothetical protein